MSQITFENPVFASMFSMACNAVPQFYEDLNIKINTVREQFAKDLRQCYNEIAAKGLDDDGIFKEETERRKALEGKAVEDIRLWRQKYMNSFFAYADNYEMRDIAMQFNFERHPLSKIHQRGNDKQQEDPNLTNLINNSLNTWKFTILTCRIKEIQSELKACGKSSSPEELAAIMQDMQSLLKLREELARAIGERVVNPV